jgi:hypothetical protein
LIHTEDNSSSYFLGPVGISDPREFIEAESRRIPFKAALSGPSCGKMLSRTGLFPQLQAGETGKRGYSQIIVQKPSIGTPFVLLNVWSYPWTRPPRTRAF